MKTTWYVTLRRKSTGSVLKLKVHKNGGKLQVVCDLKKQYPGWQIAPSDIKQTNEKK